MPLPFIYTPHPVIGMPPEALYAYIEGNDPQTGKPVITEIIDALTKPITTKAPKAGPRSRPLPASGPPCWRRTLRTTSSAFSTRRAGRTACRSYCPPKSG